MVEIIAFAGTFTHAGKHRQAGVGLGNVVDQLHHVHSFAHTGAAKQANLAALGKRAHQINHLDAGFQQLLRRAELVISRGLAVYGHVLRSIDRTPLVDWRTEHVHDAAQGGRTHRHHDGGGGVADHQTTAQSVRGPQRNGSHDAVAELLLNFQRQCGAVELERIIDIGHLVPGELHVHHRTNTLNNFSLGLSHFFAPLNLNFANCLSAGPRPRSQQLLRRFRTVPW